MGKRLVPFFAIFFTAVLSLAYLPQAHAQSDNDTSSCPSGIYSSVDGTCMGQDQLQGQSPTSDQTLPGTSVGAGAQGSYGANATFNQLTQQYPGLQSPNLANRISNFTDMSGLNGQQAQLQALNEARLLALQRPSPPTEFQLLVRASVGRLLPIYGDSLFREVPTTFAPLRNTNVTPDYVLGPGDQLIIRVWGQVNFNAQVTVDRSGSVYIPQVGEIHVAGLPYAQVR